MKHFFFMTMMLLVSIPAHAKLSCDDIMQLLKFNTPERTVIIMMKGSSSFSSSDVNCLQRNGAPKSIINQAKLLSKGSGTKNNSSQVTPKVSRASPVYNSGSQPDEIREARNKLKAKKPLTASFLLYRLLEENRYPNHVVDIHYYLGKSFEALKMYHAAQHHYLKVIIAGPKTPYFNSALPNLVKVARYTNDYYDLKRIVAKLPPHYFPRRAKNNLHYLLGTLHYTNGNLSEAQINFRKVRDKSLLGLKASYFEGVIHNKREKLKSSVKVFRDIYREAIKTDDRFDTQEAIMVTDIKDLSLMNIGRVYFGISRYKEAVSFYDKISTDSTYWSQSRLDVAWSQFYLNKLPETINTIGNVNQNATSPKKRNKLLQKGKAELVIWPAFTPEVEILYAICALMVQDYAATEEIIESFEAYYMPMRTELKSLLDNHNPKAADLLYAKLFSKSDTPYPMVQRVLLQNSEIRGILRHLAIIQEEEQRIQGQKVQWLNTVGTYIVNNSYRKNQVRYQKRAGKIIFKELQYIGNQLKELMNQASYIKIDLNQSQKADYVRKHTYKGELNINSQEAANHRNIAQDNLYSDLLLSLQIKPTKKGFLSSLFSPTKRETITIKQAPIPKKKVVKVKKPKKKVVKVKKPKKKRKTKKRKLEATTVATSSQRFPKRFMDLLAKGGWTAAEEDSPFDIGGVFEITGNQQPDPIIQGEKCFNTLPVPTPMTNMSIINMLKGGLTVPFGVVKGKVKGKRYKKTTFAATEILRLTRMDLETEITTKCRTYLRGLVTKSSNQASFYMVKAIIRSKVSEQECSGKEVTFGFQDLGVGAESYEKCGQDTLGQVTIAYQLAPLTKILGN